MTSATKPPQDAGSKESEVKPPTYECVFTGAVREERRTIFGQTWDYIVRAFKSVLYMDVGKLVGGLFAGLLFLLFLLLCIHSPGTAILLLPR